MIPAERMQKTLIGRLLGRIYTLLSVMLLFVMFRAESVTVGLRMWVSMFRFHTDAAGTLLLAKLSSPAATAVLCIALLLALSADGGRIHAFLTSERSDKPEFLPDVFCLLLFVLSVMALAQSGFHPFIYFQF